MPAKSKLTEKDKKEFIKRMARKEPIATLAMIFGISAPSAYRLKREFEKERQEQRDLADKGDLNALIDSKREFIGKRQCQTGHCECSRLLPVDYDGRGSHAARYPEANKARHTFDLYKGDERKMFCSRACFLKYEAYDFSKWNPNHLYGGEHSGEWGTKKGQEAIVKINSPLFPPEDDENLTGNTGEENAY